MRLSGGQPPMANKVFSNMEKPVWIAADWGTSNLRLWGIDANDRTLFSLSSEKGMGRIGPADYPDVLAELLAGHLPEDGTRLPLIVCGMAGAREGWREAPYLPLPARLDTLGASAVRPLMPGDGIEAHILPGLCASAPGHEDVMRGEETQLLGLLAMEPGFEGPVCLPGTHSKWAMLENSTVTRFETAMTGELFELLSTRSVLRHALAGANADLPDDDGYADGFDAGLSAPERLNAMLFRTRAAMLVSGRSPEWCRAYLSGLLVGSEIAAFRSWRSVAPIALIGSERLCSLYAKALARDGAEARIIDATKATRAGLAAARLQIKDK